MVELPLRWSLVCLVVAGATGLAQTVPTPVLTSTYPNSVVRGDGSFVNLQVRGSEFRTGLTARVGSQVRAFLYESPTQGRVPISPADFLTPGSVGVQVVTSDGRFSNPVFVSVHNGEPQVVRAGPSVILSGSPTTRVNLSGNNLYPDTGIFVNGRQYPVIANPISVTQVSIDLPAVELAQPGALQVQAINGQPGGGVSTSLLVPVMRPTSYRTSAYSSVLRRIFLSGDSAGDSIISYDPDTGLTGRPIKVGRNPGPLAFGADGVTLYVGVGSDSTIVKINAAAEQVVERIPLAFSFGPSAAPPFAYAITVDPNNINLVSAALRSTSSSDFHYTVYVNGLRQGQTLRSGDGPPLSFSYGPSSDYTYASFSSVNGIRRYRVTQQGVVADTLITGARNVFQIAGNQLYTTMSAVDLTSLQVKPLPNLGFVFCVDAPRGVIYGVRSEGAQYYLSEMDTDGVAFGSVGLASGVFNQLQCMGEQGVAASGTATSQFAMIPFRPLEIAFDAPGLLPSNIVNGASYQARVVSPTELITIFRGTASDIGVSDGTIASLGSDGRLPESLNGVRVLFDQIPGRMYYESKDQISVFVPQEIRGRTFTTVRVESKWRFAPVTVPVQNTHPGLFAVDATGSGQGAIINQDGTENSVANPANRGSFISIYGTGGGVASPNPGNGGLILQPGSLIEPIRVRIGNADAEVSYAGGAPLSPYGVFQINVKVPPQIAPSPAAPIVVQIGDYSSPLQVSVAIR